MARMSRSNEYKDHKGHQAGVQGVKRSGRGEDARQLQLSGTVLNLKPQSRLIRTMHAAPKSGILVKKSPSGNFRQEGIDLKIGGIYNSFFCCFNFFFFLVFSFSALPRVFQRVHSTPNWAKKDAPQKFDSTGVLS